MKIKQTPLEQMHQLAHAHMVDFAGWLMPLNYPSGILYEHQAVRKKVGMFDISHMGKLIISGHQATTVCDYLLTNALCKLAIHQGQYTLMLNDQGGIIDDLIIYRIDEEEYLLILNASYTDTDIEWIKTKINFHEVILDNKTDDYVGIALQGPLSLDIISSLFPQIKIPKKMGILSFDTNNGKLFIARTGYTGEEGFEFFVPKQDGSSLWKKFLDAGVTPAGLGARDILRLEMGYSLNGAELKTDLTPIEAGLSRFVALDHSMKKDFIGKKALKTDDAMRCLGGFMMEGKGPPFRAHYPIFDGQANIGEVTSGNFSPCLSKNIALAHILPQYYQIGKKYDVEIRSQRWPIILCALPFYKK